MSYKGGSCYFCNLPEAELRALAREDYDEFERHMMAGCMIDPKTPREIERARDLAHDVALWRGEAEEE